MKPFFFILFVLISCNATAQYKGGSGSGNTLLRVPLLNLGVANMYSGGNNDGAGNMSATVSLSASALYAGGADDGSSAFSANSLALGVSGMYAGGTDDGLGSGSANAVSLAAGTMYAGGANDGATSQSTSLVLLTAQNSYSGGSDDGSSAVLVNALSLATNTMYAGGINDGANGSNSTLSLAVTSSMYGGGTGDGFSSLLINTSFVPLPLSWLDFTAAAKGKDILLDWTVANENGALGYSVERSYDGVFFKSIGMIAARNDIRTTASYTYTDIDPVAECKGDYCTRVFYRIRQVQENGDYSFSEIRKIQFDDNAIIARIYPNPTSDKIMVQWNASGSKDIPYTFSLYNTTGTHILSGTGYVSAANEIDIRQIPSGTYYLKLTLTGTVYPYQITIIH